MKRQILLTPGPTPLLPSVRTALAKPIIHHRTPLYQEMVKEVGEGLKSVFQTRNDVFCFASSGTGAMETAVVNFLSPGDKVVVIVGGKFGQRWGKICQAHDLNTIVLPVRWGEACDPNHLRETLKKEGDVRVVYTTLCETSTGVRYDIKGLARVAHDQGALIAVDAISGLAADPFWMDQWEVDITVSGSQKALMLPPGLGLISVGQSAWEKVSSARLPRFYFDLLKVKNAWEDFDTPFTPAISLVVALRESLKKLQKKGIEKVWKETEKLATYTRGAITNRLGLSLFAKTPSNALTAVTVPEGVEGKQLIQSLRDKYGIWVAAGQGDLKGKIFRIAHMGYIQKKDIQLCLTALEKELKPNRARQRVASHAEVS